MYELVRKGGFAMKAELVERLITAHCSGNEQHFVDALNKLVADEEKKGNTPTAARLRKAYLPKDNGCRPLLKGLAFM